MAPPPCFPGAGLPAGLSATVQLGRSKRTQGLGAHCTGIVRVRAPRPRHPHARSSNQDELNYMARTPAAAALRQGTGFRAALRAAREKKIACLHGRGMQNVCTAAMVTTPPRGHASDPSKGSDAAGPMFSEGRMGAWI